MRVVQRTLCQDDGYSDRNDRQGVLLPVFLLAVDLIDRLLVPPVQVRPVQVRHLVALEGSRVRLRLQLLDAETNSVQVVGLNEELSVSQPAALLRPLLLDLFDLAEVPVDIRYRRGLGLRLGSPGGPGLPEVPHVGLPWRLGLGFLQGPCFLRWWRG